MNSIPFQSDFEKRTLSDSFLGQDLLTALDTRSPTTLRKNPFKPTFAFTESKKIEWCENAYSLDDRPSFTLDPLFHAGTYYPQESGSMMLDIILRQIDLPQNPTILDLCAAPGGKSTLIASYLNNVGLLVSNEVIQTRAKILYENLSKWGGSNVVVTNSDPKQFEKIPAFFDCVVVDAPCSGEGMFRKNPATRTEWSNENVSLCAARQKRIVHDIWESLKPNAYLIYSTCTFNSTENEENIQYLLESLDAEIIQLKNCPAQTDRLNLGYYCMPHLLNTEGFYFAVIKKKDAGLSTNKMRPNINLIPVKTTDEIASLLAVKPAQVYQWKDTLFHLNPLVADKMVHLQQQLHIVKLGTKLGDVTRKGLKWSDELALSYELNAALPSVDFDLDQALRYLKCETFPLPLKSGTYLAKYNGITIGAFKQIGNRFNTFWPKEWRIRQRLD